ncbi:hypothetical protein HBH70_228010 [Parastagonospora nodorum]|nr:hypothetical protein HBH53_219840 [Parastagonospora nodorum]KAH4053243.1 hypothetical protein HBH49_097240 [Parastagonospora nodorum]KAH4072946.1 hypothetical protein HBH50_047340 [Parastagonospora nodorum]KAH4099999.1 hypothetical protein HBH48_014680 [Parastagonospora nodorum]KAH4108985.1 hypothetical protein HBH46_032970 [Parastagonospora nodorum]
MSPSSASAAYEHVMIIDEMRRWYDSATKTRGTLVQERTADAFRSASGTPRSTKSPLERFASSRTPMSVIMEPPGLLWGNEISNCRRVKGIANGYFRLSQINMGAVRRDPAA